MLREPFQRAQTAQSPLADIRPARSEPPENLTALKESFIAETGYPTDDDRKHQLLLREWQPELTPERLASVPVSTLRRMYNGGGYGSPGPQSILNSSLAGEDPDVIDRFRQALNHLLWSEEDAADRIDAVMDETRLGIRGFKEGAIMKFLAIAHPDDFLAVYPFSGERGKAAILTALGKPAPPLTALSASVKWLQTTPSMTQFVISSLTTHETRNSSGFTKGQELRQHEISTEPLRQRARIQSPMQPMTSRSRQISSKTSEISFPKIDRWSFTASGTGKTFVAQRLAKPSRRLMSSECWSSFTLPPATRTSSRDTGQSPAQTTQSSTS